MKLPLTFTMVLLSFGLASAGTVYSVTGTPNGFAYSLGGTSDQMLVSSWAQTGSYTNVSISAVLGSGEPISVYLTNQIGPGTTVANEIGSTSISPSASPQTETLFTGLSLGAGSYYLVLAAPTTGIAGWFGTSSPTVTTDTGVTGHPDVFVSTSNGSPNSAFPPASSFLPAGTNLLFTVTGDVGSTVPEPSSFMMMGLAGIFLFSVKSRLPR